MSTEKSLVIVESPAKARTISKFLGKDFAVEASIGHIRDLPKVRKEIPEQYKSEEWAYLGVNIDDEFQPVYIVPVDKKKQVSKLKALMKECKQVCIWRRTKIAKGKRSPGTCARSSSPRSRASLGLP
jgi:DNA topoisomerase I